MLKQRLILIVWKPHFPIESTIPAVKRVQAFALSSNTRIMIALAMNYVSELKKSEDFFPLELGVDSILSPLSGTFTEAISGKLLKEVKAEFVLIGTYAERVLKQLDNAHILAKIQAAADQGIPPVLCVGETWEDYQAGNSLQVLKEQLADLTSYADIPGFKIVYEAPWLHQNPHLNDLNDLVNAYETCRQVVTDTLGESSIEILCGLPHELQNISKLSQLLPADGYFFSRGSYFLQFTPEQTIEEPKTENEEDSPEKVAEVVGEALLAAASEEELREDVSDSEPKINPKRSANKKQY